MEENQFPTEGEKTDVYQYCTKSRLVANAKKTFTTERKPWNTKCKEVREGILKKMLEKEVACYQIDKQYLRVQQCKSYVALTDEIVSEGVYGIDPEKYEGNALALVDDVVDMIEEKRTRRKQYAKVMKTPPKNKGTISTDPPDGETLSLLREYDDNQEKLTLSRKREKEELQTTKEEIKGLKEAVNDYMVRVNLESQRVNLPFKDTPNKPVKGVAETFFIRRKDRVVTKKITKKDLKTIVLFAMEGIVLAEFVNARDIIVQRVLNKAQEFKQVKKDLSFDHGGLKQV
jgi:hypothetical protein